MSWKATGLYAYLCSLPGDWEINVEDLKNRKTDGRDSTRAALNELRELGFIAEEKVRSGGRFGGI
jgi:hypothetical protein